MHCIDFSKPILQPNRAIRLDTLFRKTGSEPTAFRQFSIGALGR